MGFVFCSQCSFYSPSHDGCFHPKAWQDTYPFKSPGDPRIINGDYLCSWYDPVPPPEPVQPDGQRGFLRRLFRPWKIRVRMR